MSKNNIENPYVGAVCRKGNKVILEKTPAGYCLGTWDEDGPCCRISGYASNEKDAAMLVPDRVCEENLFCNGGKGCGIRKNEDFADDATYFAVVETSVKLVAIPKKSVSEATEGLPDCSAQDVLVDLLLSQYHAEHIELTPEDFAEVNFYKLDPGTESEYSYLLDKKSNAQVVEL